MFFFRIIAFLIIFFDGVCDSPTNKKLFTKKAREHRLVAISENWLSLFASKNGCSSQTLLYRVLSISYFPGIFLLFHSSKLLSIVFLFCNSIYFYLGWLEQVWCARAEQVGKERRGGTTEEGGLLQIQVKWKDQSLYRLRSSRSGRTTPGTGDQTIIA